MTEREIEEMAADGVLREPMLLRYVAQWYRDPDKRLGPALTGTTRPTAGATRWTRTIATAAPSASQRTSPATSV